MGQVDKALFPGHFPRLLLRYGSWKLRQYRRKMAEGGKYRHLQSFGNLAIIRWGTIAQTPHWCWWEPRYNGTFPYLIGIFNTKLLLWKIQIKFPQRVTWGRTRQSWKSWKRTTDPQWPHQRRRNMQRTKGSRNTWNARPRIKRWSIRYPWKWWTSLSGSQRCFWRSYQDCLEQE